MSTRVDLPTRAGMGAAATILVAALIAGMLDISSAFIEFGLKGVSPARILKAIAGGVLGARAFNGGPLTAAFGLCCHFFIALCAAAVFYVLARQFSAIMRHPIASGVLYGIAVYVIMNRLVVPLSALPPRYNPPLLSALHVTEHILCIGLPISMAVRFLSRFGDQSYLI
jgi:uncharacterized membrane protein YagU involved in acid resistance